MRKTLLVSGIAAIMCAALFQAEFAAQEREPADFGGTVQDDEAKMRAIAIKPDAPRVSLSGNVFMPDGSLAPSGEVSVWFVIPVQRDDGYRIYGGEDAARFTTRIMPGDIQDNTFQIDGRLRAGSNVAVTAFSTDKKYLSKPITFVAREDMEPLKITLEEGIPVRGKIMYENGTPALERPLFLRQHIEPVVGSDIPRMREWFHVLHRAGIELVAANETGEYEVFLLPGEYTLQGSTPARNGFMGPGGRKETFTIAAADTEKRFDMTMPTPVFIEVVLEDGSPANGNGFVYANEESPREIHPQTHSFLLDVDDYNGTIYIYDSVSKQGTIEKITPEMVGSTQKFQLQPMGNALLKLINADGKPISGQGVRLRLRTGVPADSRFIVSRATTDSDGFAVLHVPAGKMSVALQLDDAPARQFENKNEIVKDLDLAPYETVYFGAIKLTQEGQLAGQRPEGNLQ